jgi:hypothetical protein
VPRERRGCGVLDQATLSAACRLRTARCSRATHASPLPGERDRGAERQRKRGCGARPADGGVSPMRGMRTGCLSTSDVRDLQTLAACGRRRSPVVGLPAAIDHRRSLRRSHACAGRPGHARPTRSELPGPQDPEQRSSAGPPKRYRRGGTRRCRDRGRSHRAALRSPAGAGAQAAWSCGPTPVERTRAGSCDPALAQSDRARLTPATAA